MGNPFGCWQEREPPCFVSRREAAPPSRKSLRANCLAASPVPVLRKIHSSKAAWPSATRAQALPHRFRYCESEENFPTRPVSPPFAAKYAAERPPAADNPSKRKAAQAWSRFDQLDKARHLVRRGHGSPLRQSIDADPPA